jgi:hypothetical protein
MRVNRVEREKRSEEKTDRRQETKRAVRNGIAEWEDRI